MIELLEGNILIVLVGLPRSGKSTWARKTGLPMVNPDSIRLAMHGQRYAREAEPMVWAVTEYMVNSLFLAGHRVVILDATNTTRVRRAAWESNTYTTVYRVFDTDPATCIARAEADHDDVLVSVIDRMVKEWQPLVSTERQVSDFEIGVMNGA